MLKVLKAIAAAATAGATWVGTSLADGEITSAELAALPPALLVAYIAVYYAKNAPA